MVQSLVVEARSRPPPPPPPPTSDVRFFSDAKDAKGPAGGSRQDGDKKHFSPLLGVGAGAAPKKGDGQGAKLGTLLGKVVITTEVCVCVCVICLWVFFF